MKKLLSLITAGVFIISLCSQVCARSPEENINNPYYQVKCSIFQSMPRDEGSIVFLGDSLTDYVKFEELMPGLNIKNRGIAGDSTVGVLHRLDEVLSLKPSKLFMLIGTNDIVYGMSAEETLDNIRKITARFHEESPKTKIYIQKIFPVNHKFETNRPSEAINAINAGLEKLADSELIIDTYSLFAVDGELPERYTIDGIHLNGAGVIRWVDFLSRWITEPDALSREDERALIQKALDVMPNSYAPYSKFNVAAAVLCESGKIYTGVNVENASYPAGICAEQNAISNAISAGEKRIRAIAIAGGANGLVDSYCSPCGICRQVMREFCEPENMLVIMAKTPDNYVKMTLGQLLPLSFGPDSLNN